jgi:uncharacterized membrane protein
MKNLLKEIPELITANVIDEATAERIKKYYQSRESPSNRLILVFGILGALLTGLGIILIIAHNWYDLSRPVKLFLALTPLFIGQALCGFTLWVKRDTPVMRESSAVFLLLAVGASISIVSQIYHIHGKLGPFLLVWTLLSLPIIYVMKSRMASLLVIIGATAYAVTTNWEYPRATPWLYWPIIVSVIPFYFNLQFSPGKNFISFHTWFLAISLIISLGTFSTGDEELLFIAYMSLFSGFIIVATLYDAYDVKINVNALNILGNLGVVVILLTLSFDDTWSDFKNITFNISEALVVSVGLFAVAFFAVLFLLKKTRTINELAFMFLLFVPLFFVGTLSSIAGQIICNVLLFLIAMVIAKRGAAADNLLIVNYGVMVMAALITCRFFDSDLSFVLRGILFILVGLSFFAANYYTLKKRNTTPL